LSAGVKRQARLDFMMRSITRQLPGRSEQAKDFE